MTALKLLAIASLSLGAGLACAQGQGKVKPPAGVEGRVVDAAGKDIGPYNFDGTTGRVLTIVNSRLVSMRVGRYLAPSPTGGAGTMSRLAPISSGSGSGQFFFEDSACNGTPYFRSVDLPPGTYPSMVIADGMGGGTIYVGPDDIGLVRVIAAVQRVGQECVPVDPQQSRVVPVIDVVQLPSLFAAPFTIR